MNLQINLLKKNEQRYQGIVSMKVLVVGASAVFIGILVIFFLLAVIAKGSLNASLEHARREWARQEPVEAAIRRQSEAAACNGRTLSMLEGWAERTGAPMYQIMHELQCSVPAQMQFSRLYAGVMPNENSGKPEYQLQLSGWAVGKGGNLLAVEFKRSLNANEVIRNFCGEIRLVSSQREMGEVWLFALEGRKTVEGGK